MKNTNDSLLALLKNILQCREITQQEEICQALNENGYVLHQSQISRLLRKLGAIKITKLNGKSVYTLPYDLAPPKITQNVSELISKINHNGSIIVVNTSPGAASLVARLIDHNFVSKLILGTIAGDDTIFISPANVQDIESITKKLNEFFK